MAVQDITSMFDKSVRMDRISNIASAVDVISAVTKCANPHMLLSRMPLAIKLDKHQFPGQGQRSTPVIHFNHIVGFIKVVMANCKMSETGRSTWACKLGLDIDDTTWYKKGTIEYDTIETVLHAFSDYTCIRQLPVRKYRVDLFIKELNLAVECDEYGHIAYNQEAEAARTEAITTDLQCTWVRFNPHAADFNIGHVISQIRMVERQQSIHAYMRL